MTIQEPFKREQLEIDALEDVHVVDPNLIEEMVKRERGRGNTMRREWKERLSK